MTVGIAPTGDSNTGALFLPATGAPERASGKFRPFAIYTTGTPELKLASEIAADVANRFDPAKRETEPAVKDLDVVRIVSDAAEAAGLATFDVRGTAIAGAGLKELASNVNAQAHAMVASLSRPGMPSFIYPLRVRMKSHTSKFRSA
jgi:hypothetical protein